MSDIDDDSRRPGGAARPAVASYLSQSQKLSIGIITGAALVLFIALRTLPIGSSVNHMDFRMEGKGAIEFCDPSNPQFIPVVAARSPVVMTLVAAEPPEKEKPSEFTLTLRTASGKPIGPADLLVAHTEKLHLLIADPTLADYQHIHPVPGRKNGEWKFTMTPHRSGAYRVFADFTPAATQRGLYASADFSVPGTVPTVFQQGNTTVRQHGLIFTLELAATLRAGQPSDLRFRIESQSKVKEPVPLQPVMGAFAHLVAFDEARTGFAHLHPAEVDLSKPPDAVRPELNFKVTIPQSGRYVIWAQVNLGGDEEFVPFWIEVLP